VVAKQGEGSLRASALTIVFLPSAGDGAAEPGVAAAGSQVTRMEAAGPVTITQRDQIGVGASANYERASNTVTLSGDVSLTQGPDIVKGDRLIYNLTTGQAQVVGRVTSLFNPGGPAPAAVSHSSGSRRHGRTERGRAAASEALRN
jgi:lipopolysaccharide export system protein LptA